jgi:hypothetical protein
MQKKLTERWQLERFIESYAKLPGAEIRDSESPDFVIVTNAGRIGIEVTQLYRSPDAGRFPLKKVETFRESIVHRARDIYTQRGAPTVDVGVLFSDNFQGRQDREAIAEKLATFVQQVYPVEEPWVIVWNDDVGISMPEELERVRIITERKAATGSWLMTQSGWLPKLDRSLLQKAFDAKNPRVSAYREKAKQVWLLLMLDAFYFSSSFSVPEEVVTQPYRSGFDQAFLFSAGERQWWPLIIQS